ncbi:prolyl 4-hydroxylase subunit alpha-2-like isoform X6 [Tachypleus tridentatus]|uniref:prolyl 4-hydroxylase subunit alpha-2-like isoform X6 n=1 Tax=Tachypleus tridentatus TaxID=6853 RepID=UPI003FD0FCF2
MVKNNMEKKSKELLKKETIQQTVLWRTTQGNGYMFQPLKWDKDLKCRYFSGHHPYLLIQPIKLEEKSHKPYIVQLHDAISDQEIQRLKNISQLTVRILHRPSHYVISGEFEASLMRTSARTIRF